MEVVWLVDFDTPTGSIPLNQFSRLVQGRHGTVGQQAPIQGFDAHGCRFFTRPQRGDLDRLAPFGLHRHRFDPHRESHRSARSVRPGWEHEGHFALNGGVRQAFPEGIAFGQFAILGSTDQPIHPRLTLRPSHEFMNVAFPVSDIDQTGLGQREGPFRAALEAFQPAHAFLGLNRPVASIFAKRRAIARPHPGIQHAQGHPPMLLN